MQAGCIEVLSPHFIIGWAMEQDGAPAYVVASCDDRILGVAQADIRRPDLAGASPGRQAFIIVFRDPIEVADLERLQVRALGNKTPLVWVKNLRRDLRPTLQIFVLGSPRSGTSELAGTLADCLALPWVGEGHAAPAFAAAATALAGSRQAQNQIPRLMADHGYQKFAYQAARRAYYWSHVSSSFLDKTPGVEMIRSTEFLARCFPSAYFVFARRNGISNVLSRMVKFGGNFESHCRDWAAAMDGWAEYRDQLPHYLEVEQEQMLGDPDGVAKAVCAYIGRPDAAEAIADSLRFGSRQRTGAGLRRASFADTDWTAAQIEQFRRLCGPTMLRWGYPLD